MYGSCLEDRPRRFPTIEGAGAFVQVAESTLFRSRITRGRERPLLVAGSESHEFWVGPRVVDPGDLMGGLTGYYAKIPKLGAWSAVVLENSPVFEAQGSTIAFGKTLNSKYKMVHIMMVPFVSGTPEKATRNRMSRDDNR